MRYAPQARKSPPHLLQRFAVCDIPLYTICDYNVSRDRCKELGCCFYKSVCYEKVVPVYVHVFSILVVIIAAAFMVTIFYKIVQERRKRKEILTEPALPPKASSELAETSQGELGASKLHSVSVSKKSVEGSEEETSTVKEPEDTED